MSNSKAQQDKTPKVLILTQEAARKICKKHGHRKAAQEVVDALPYRASLKSAGVAELVEEQISMFAQSLVKCVERAIDGAGKIEQLPSRAEQGAALREIRAALESLRDVVERKWELVRPLLEIDTAEHLDRLLTTEAAKELLPPKLRAEYNATSEDKDEYTHQHLKLSYLLKAGPMPLTALIEGAAGVVQRAEKRVLSGAPLKTPLEIALIMQLADHYEWALQQKASWSEGGPFSRFCADVFEELALESTYEWGHLLKQGLKHHRSSFGVRRRHERQENPICDGSQPRKRQLRKQKLVRLTKRKTPSEQ